MQAPLISRGSEIVKVGVDAVVVGVAGQIRGVEEVGQQSVEILREIGYSDAEIDAMIAGGVTVDGRLKKQ